MIWSPGFGSLLAIFLHRALITIKMNWGYQKTWLPTKNICLAPSSQKVVSDQNKDCGTQVAPEKILLATTKPSHVPAG